MELITDTGSCPDLPNGSVVTIGAYDGVHLGHRAVIDVVRTKAAALDAASAVVTFDRHPAAVVRPESAPRLLTDSAQKIELLATTGVDLTVMLRFDEQRAAEDAEEFVEEVLVQCLRARAVVVGVDFHFGHLRRGNVALLTEMGKGHGFEVFPVDLLDRVDGVHEPISSTAIRRALAAGEVDVAHRLLGRPFEVRGPVVKGDERGRLLGFPTANVLVPDSMCLPADGVYAGYYQRPDGERFACAINLGRRPTFYEHADHSLLEVHLLEFAGDLYGERAKVTFLQFLRSERKFEGIDPLVAQLKNDIVAARGALAP